MKKILMFQDLCSSVHTEKDFLNRTDLKLLTAISAEDIMKIHRLEQVDLIVMQLDMDGTSAENLCAALRKDEGLKHVSILIICTDTKSDLDRVQKCKANSYVTKPIRHEHLIEKISQLLSIPDRQAYRVLLKVRVNGKTNTDPFFCSSYNISSTGMLIETEKELVKTDVISCSFFLPNSEQIITDAEIVRTLHTRDATFQYGIRFINLSQRHRTEIDKFVRRRSVKA
jgi:DNA-binding response OmpR family regulator